MRSEEIWNSLADKIYQLIGEDLNDLEKKIFLVLWEGRSEREDRQLTYEEVSRKLGYTKNHVQFVASNMFRNKFTEAFRKCKTITEEQKVDRYNFRDMVERFLNQQSYQCSWGNLRLSQESCIHVDRPLPEASCYEELQKPNALIRIKGSGRMGKTALAIKTLKQFEMQSGYRTAYLNMHLASQDDFSDLNRFLQWFCISVGQGLSSPNLLSEQWDEQFSSPKVNCSRYFERNFIPPDDNTLILCLDDLDCIFVDSDLTSEFSGLLRAWYETAKTTEKWKKLKLLLVHSTEPYAPLNIRQSPFQGVGTTIELNELTLELAQELCQKYDLNLTDDQLRQLMQMIGGHPALLGEAFSYLSSNSSAVNLDKLLENAPTDSGIYGSHLRHLNYILQQRPEIRTAFLKAINSDCPVQLEREPAYQLVRLGIARFEQGDKIVPLCNLYRQYFHECPTSSIKI